MSEAARKRFSKYQLALAVAFTCIISFSQTYAADDVKVMSPVAPVYKIKPLPEFAITPVKPIPGTVLKLLDGITPLLINHSESKARSMLKQRRLKLGTVRRRELPTGRGVIISQKPRAGTRMSFGQKVDIVISIPPVQKPLKVSIYPPLRTVVQGYPAVFDADYNKKRVRLNWQMNQQSGTSKRFTVNTKNLKPGSYSVKLFVTESSQLPLSERIGFDTRGKRANARLIVKAADEVFKSVPNVLRYSRKEALEIIHKSGLSLRNITEKPTITFPNDIVFKQWPSAGKKLKAGGKVDLWVYKQKLEPLQVKITPSKRVIEQGETVTFIASSKTQSLRYNWSGAGKTSTTNRFVINSNNLPPDTYTVTLTVRDKQGRRIANRAVLQVKKKLITVPDVTQRYRSQALTLLQSKGFKPGKVEYKTLSRGHNDWVLEQQPATGTKVLPNSKIDLIVSKHPPLPPLEVRINPPNPAIKKGKEVTFVVESKNELTSYRWEGAGQKSSTARFIIQSQNLPARSYEIKLTVSDRHSRKKTAGTTLQVIKLEESMISVPNVNSFKLDDAIRRLQTSQLNTGNISYKVITSGDEGRVVGQTPEAGVKVKPDSKVDLRISKLNPQAVLITVPDLLGKDIESARKILIVNGLLSGSIRERKTSSGDDQTVLEQIPKAMAQVKKGAVVNLIISSISPLQQKDFIIELNVERTRHLAGKATRFLLKPSDPNAIASYWLQLDKGQSSERFSQTHYEHVFKQSGIHSVYAKARVNGRVYQSEPVNIWILPSWLIPIVAGLGLLTLGAGVAKAVGTSSTKVVKKLKPTRISVEPITDLGYQEISRVSLVEGKDSNIDGQEYHISVSFDNTLTDGEWEVLIEETHKKIKGSYSDEQENKT